MMKSRNLSQPIIDHLVHCKTVDSGDDDGDVDDNGDDDRDDTGEQHVTALSVSQQIIIHIFKCIPSG